MPISLGRNEPCHCGSGKKYKKCCLHKDEESQHQEAMGPLDASANRQSPGNTTEGIDTKTPKPAPDPHAKARDARWREFEAAEYEDQLKLFVRTLDDADLMDEEMSFDMLNEIFCASAKRGDRERFNALLERLRERLPDIYAKDKAYFLKWRITNELVAGRSENIPNLMREMAPLAGKDIDVLNHVEQRVAYHGYLTPLVEAMRIAWPDVESSSDIVPWGIDEFNAHAVTYEILGFADGPSGPVAADSSLLERLRLYSEIDTAQVC